MRRRANLTEKMPPFTTSHVNTRVFKMACTFAAFSRFGQREYDVIMTQYRGFAKYLIEARCHLIL